MLQPQQTRRLDDVIEEHRICRRNHDERWMRHELIHKEMAHDRKVNIRFFVTFTVTVVSQIFLTIYLHYFG